MLLIRDIFYCKPGKVRPLVQRFKAMNDASQRLGLATARLMTDLSAERYWTVVSEWEVKNLQEFEEMMATTADTVELEDLMKGYHELVESGRREIYTIES